MHAINLYIIKMMSNKLDKFLGWIEARGGKRVITRPNDATGEILPYLDRFYIIKSKYCELMIHRFHQSDRGDIHDHPWPSYGWILRKGYIEHVLEKDGTVQPYQRLPGNFNWRRATDFHRVELRPGEAGSVLTLFGTLKRKRNWGFLVNGEWVGWKTYCEVQLKLETSGGEPNEQYVGWLFPHRVVV